MEEGKAGLGQSREDESHKVRASPPLVSVTSSMTTPSLSESSLHSPPSTEPDPSGLQGLQLPTAGIDSNDESESALGDSESEFDDVEAQKVFND